MSINIRESYVREKRRNEYGFAQSSKPGLCVRNCSQKYGSREGTHKKAESGAVPPGYEPYCQKKSGKATLTIQSKYNPSVVFTSELYVDMLSEDVFTFSHGYIGYYDGTKKDPEVKIYRSGLTLTEGTDYTATYKGDQVNAGTFTVTFTGIG